MKKYIIIIATLLLTACTEEIFINELQYVEPKLVIEAIIDVNKITRSRTSTQTIKLSYTSSYYSNEYPAVLGATVSITDSIGNSMGTFLDINPDVVDDIEDGTYTAVDFQRPTLGETYIFTTTIEGEDYIAEETYNSIVGINMAYQSTNKSPFGDDEITEVNFNVDNEIGVDNYYLTEFNTSIQTNSEFDTGDDGFYLEEEGKNNFDIGYSDDELNVGDEVELKLYGISQQYYNYMSILLQIAAGGDGGGGGPFSTAPASVRGNIINQTNQENYALGYFSMNQFISQTYTIIEPTLVEETEESTDTE